MTTTAAWRPPASSEMEPPTGVERSTLARLYRTETANRHLPADQPGDVGASVGADGRLADSFDSRLRERGRVVRVRFTVLDVFHELTGDVDDAGSAEDPDLEPAADRDEPREADVPPVLVVREIARLPGDVPRLIEEERMRDLRRDVSFSRIVEPRVRCSGEQVAPDPPSSADLELHTRPEGVVRRPCLLLAIQRLAVCFAEVAGRDLPAHAEGHETSNVAVPGRWRRLVRSWRCRLRTCLEELWPGRMHVKGRT